ncbi:MAG: hypothetical protein KBT07_09190 [Clostridiales bacterium]|nr:hypothetical protein [Candidatus Scatonaster coprocaballi]
MDIVLDVIFEAILELVIEGSIEGSKSSKIPKPIRYLLFGLVLALYLGLVGLIIAVGVITLGDSVLFGILLFALAAFILMAGVIKFRKTYLFRRR